MSGARLAIVALLLALAGCATPGGDYGPTGETVHGLPVMERQRIEWTDTQKAAFGLGVAMTLADVYSTVDGLDRGCREANPIYGEHPSLFKLLAIKSALTAFQFLYADWQIQKGRDPSTGMFISAGITGIVVGWNLTRDCD